ncbi:MAG: T9SS type A sorting domain-containing protein [Polaribacter sp.]|uniref:T9SS type A sorting domain-containing protein n=1 Tax=Polaribacter sp. TaxID=1920175 RepID=UPI003BAEE758
MKKNYLFTLLLTLFISAFSFGQTTVFQESFETGNSGTASETCNDNSGDFFTRTDGSDITSDYQVSGQDGNFFFAAMDTDGSPCTSSLQTLFFDDIDISSKSNLTLALLLAEDQPSDSNFDWDGGDLFYIEVDYDNSGTYTKVLQFATSANTGFNVSAPMQDTNFDGVGDGQALTDVFSEFTLSLGTGNLVDIRLVFDGLNNGDEDIAVDNIRVIDGFVVTPELTIISPKEEELSARTSVDVEFSVSNFNVAAANAGDGYVKYNIDNGASVDLFDTNTFSIPVTPGQAYNLNMELVDNSGNSLSPAVFKNVNFSIAYPCDLNLGAITTTCITSTSATDTYDISIDFTGGNTSTYTLATDNGTIGGDNPSTNATGTILISGVTEGTNVVFTVQGDGANSSCDLTRNISSPSCVAFPVIDEFDYAVGVNLADQTPWTKVNSGDEMLIAAGNLDYTGLKASTGNKLTFDGSGSESYISFADVTSGTVYASFLLKVTDISAMTDVADGGYIASLAGSTSGYDARFWVRPNPDASGTTYDIGFGAESSNPPFTSGTYNVNDVLFVVMAYNKDTNTVSTWINPDVSSFESTIPTATLSSTDTFPASAINLFILRQDSTGETPFVEIDALRISDNWPDVTPKDATASVRNNMIEGFATYPNPVTNNSFTITTNSADKKEVVIFNVLGKKVLSTSFSATKADINVTTISSGIYILKVTEGTKTATSKLVIR